MTTIRDIVRYAGELAPFSLADDWDNVGLLVGDENVEVNTVLLALDITPAVIREAHEKGASLIVSHHPVIFDPLRSLTPDEPAYQLAQYGIAALCLHTNLDRAEQGVNTALAEAIGLTNTVFYPDDYILVGDPLTEMSADDFARHIKERLRAPSVRYTDGRVSRVAVSSGGGGEGVTLAEQYGFDAFVTGELKHHHYNYAISHGIAAFDAGHFSTEDVVIRPLCERFAAHFPEVRFIVSEACVCPCRSV
jgi:dinuclear metal center YbgI/SA1388 family protein